MQSLVQRLEDPDPGYITCTSFQDLSDVYDWYSSASSDESLANDSIGYSTPNRSLEECDDVDDIPGRVYNRPPIAPLEYRLKTPPTIEESQQDAPPEVESDEPIISDNHLVYVILRFFLINKKCWESSISVSSLK